MECEQAFGCIVAKVGVILFQEFANNDSTLHPCIGSNCMRWSLEISQQKGLKPNVQLENTWIMAFSF